MPWVHCFFKGLCDERDELNQQTQARIVDRQELISASCVACPCCVSRNRGTFGAVAVRAVRDGYLLCSVPWVWDITHHPILLHVLTLSTVHVCTCNRP